jgi:hypothetical protein
MGLVIVDDAPIGSSANYGGLVAAPVFSKIASRAVRYLDIPQESAAVMAQSANASTITAGTH